MGRQVHVDPKSGLSIIIVLLIQMLGVDFDQIREVPAVPTVSFHRVDVLT